MIAATYYKVRFFLYWRLSGGKTPKNQNIDKIWFSNSATQTWSAVPRILPWHAYIASRGLTCSLSVLMIQVVRKILQFLGFAFIFLSSDISSECVKFGLSMKNININIKSQNENVNEDMNDNNWLYKFHLMGLCGKVWMAIDRITDMQPMWLNYRKCLKVQAYNSRFGV